MEVHRREQEDVLCDKVICLLIDLAEYQLLLLDNLAGKLDVRL
jgi:hypothetical protein